MATAGCPPLSPSAAAPPSPPLSTPPTPSSELSGTSSPASASTLTSSHLKKSEFIAKCYMRRTFISGFTGSAGTAVVTKDKAALWTDGSYFLQAEKH
ncbi:PREDICTED: xaa-Pro aminopeptidase 1-like [Fragaria vesca subsp. vesca]